MAQSSLLKDKVRQARNTLLAKNIIATVDGIHEILGGSASKAAIRRSLKRLKTQDSRKYTGEADSDGLQTLVNQLVERIREDIQQCIDTLQRDHRIRAQKYQETIVSIAETADNLRGDLQQRERELHDITQAHQVSKEALRREVLERQNAERQVLELKGKLTDSTAGYLALEQKYPGAKETLKHYRRFAKEEYSQQHQRLLREIHFLQENNQQLQQMLEEKSRNLTQLNQEIVQLNNDLQHAHQALQEANETAPKSVKPAQQNDELADLNDEQDAQLQYAQDRFNRTYASQREIIGRMLRLEMELASARSALRAQQELTAQYQAFLALRGLKLGG